MARVYVTRLIPQAGLDLLSPHHDLDVWQGDLLPSPEELLRGARHADAIISLLTESITEEVISAAPSLKVIANMAVGYDNVDIQAATKRSIVVTNTPDVLTETTADFAWALMLAAARRIPEGIEYVREGRWRTWETQTLLGQDVWGATLGLIGLGRIGGAVARRARGFNMRVLYHTLRPHPDAAGEGLEWSELEALLTGSDFVSLHIPLTPATRGLIDARRLARMKPSAILVNTSRGPVVESAALYDALKDGTITAAALDVTDPEPLPPDHPLLTLSNCIVLPHLGSASYATRNRMATMAAENVLAVLTGKRAPNAVNAGAPPS